MPNTTISNTQPSNFISILDFIDQLIIKHPFLSIGCVSTATLGIGLTTFTLGITAASTAIFISASFLVGFIPGVAETVYRQASLTPKAATTLTAAEINIPAVIKELSRYHSDIGFLPFGGDGEILQICDANIKKIQTAQSTTDEISKHSALEAQVGLKSLCQKYISPTGKVIILFQDWYNYYFAFSSDTLIDLLETAEEETEAEELGSWSKGILDDVFNSDEERYYEIVENVLEGNFPENIKGEDVIACSVADWSQSRRCIKKFGYHLTKRQEKQFNLIYKEALSKNLGLADEKSVLAIHEKITALEIAVKEANQNYDVAQAAVTEYKKRWLGLAITDKDEWTPRWNLLDPKTHHYPGQQTHLQTKRRYDMWDAIKKRGDFPGDLSDSGSEISNTCLVSPGTDNFCADSIRQEMNSRREKDKKAKEAKEKLEAVKEVYDLVQSWSNKLTKTNDACNGLQAQVNSLIEERDVFEQVVGQMEHPYVHEV